MNNSTTRCRRASSNQDAQVGDGEEIDAETNPMVANNRRLGYHYEAENSAGGSSIFLSPSSHQGHWCEEDKLFPLKKRKASFACKLRVSMASNDEQKKGVREASRKTGKSAVKHIYDHENEEEQEDDAVGKYEANKRKVGERAKTVMTNSDFCSRNSGSGWRCNRPTVLGHSFCGYHLSYSRARHRNHVRIRNRQNGPKNIIDNFTKVYPSLYLEEDDDDYNDKVFEKRCVKKARSISSLLSAPN